MKTKPVLPCCLLILLAASTGWAERQPCHLEVEPAATLLLPYFEVDLGDAQGSTTLMSIHNAGWQPVVAQVTLWTDFALSTLDFQVFLTGYDVQTLNLRDVFEGRLPVTADAAGDPTGDLSPEGLPGWDGTVGDCADFLPYDVPFASLLVERLRDAHRGRPSAFDQGLCLGYDHGDDVARGFVTVDVVNNCGLDIPGDAGYFAAGGTGVASNDNRLWGDFFLVDPGDDFAQGEPLVHVQAFDTFADGDYTFYGALVGESAVDGREPLPNAFASRFMLGGAFDGGTELLVWRDPKIWPAAPVSCGEMPNPFPLRQGQVWAFDEQEQWIDTCGFIFGADPPPDGRITPPPPPEHCYPLAAQRVKVGEESLTGDLFDVPFEFGWLYLPMDHGGGIPFDYVAQGWVVALHSASGRFSVGLPATAVHSACDGEAYLEF